MTFAVTIYATRKQGTTPQDFKTHYEDTHMPLVKSLSGELFPKSHTRHYIQRTPTAHSTDTSNKAYPANVLFGGQAVFDFDSYAELVFEDGPAFQRFIACVTAPEAARKIGDDEDCFLDRDKMRVAFVDDTRVTT